MKTSVLTNLIKKLSDVGYGITTTTISGTPAVKCSFIANNRIMSFNLITTSKNTFILQAPTYTFTNTLSHFRYGDHSDIRTPYSKTIIKQMIKRLQKASVWEIIENRENFIEVNTYCHNAFTKSDVLNNEITKLIGK